MSSRVDTITVDATDAGAVAAFWAELLGWARHVSDAGWFVRPPASGAPELLFIEVPEGKQVKNRVHLDLRPDDQDAEVARAEALGATRVDVGQSGEEPWVVLADPEGNEFCILPAR